MLSLWYLTIKNLKLLLRAKSSALIVVFAPLLLILILGLSYNNSSTNLKLGVYAPAFGADVNSFVSTLQENDYEIITYKTAISDCVKDLRSGVVHTCISLPADLQIAGNQRKEITFYIDPSKINLVWMIQEVVSQKFQLKSQQISQDLTQNVLTTLSSTKDGLASRSGDVSSLKEKTTAASTSASSTKSSLAGVDTTLPPDGFDSSAIAAFIVSLNATKNKVNSALTALDTANISSSESSAIRSSLTAAQTSLTAAIVSATSTTTGTLGGEIILLQQALDATQVKLITAGQTITASASSLDAVSGTLQESQTALDALQTSLGEMQTKIDSQKVTDAATISSPLVTKIEKVSAEGTFLNYTFSVLLILVLMFSSLLLGTTLVMMEKNSPAFLRNFFMPIRKTTFVISTYLTNVILIIIQLIIVLGISLFFLDNLAGVLPQIILILFLAASVFTFLGMVLGYIFTSEETGVLASISLGSLFLFLSGVIIPLENVSIVLREITLFNPFVIAEKLARQVFIFNASFEAIWFDLLILLGYTIILFLIILMAESLLHEHLIHNFLRQHHKVHIVKDTNK